MSTEEEDEEKVDLPTFKDFIDKWFPQLSMYAWQQEMINKWASPFAVMSISPVSSVKSVMDKVEEFNKAVDEEDWEKVDEELHIALNPIIDDGKEFTLEMLEKELEDEVKEGENSIEQVGDSPEEVGRQIHEACERLGINEREFPNRAPIFRPLWRMRGCPGSVFLAHQNEPRTICSNCVREVCSDDLRNTAKECNFCPGFVSYEEVDKIKCNCACCGRELDEPENFPPDFPDQWKICCWCHDIWLYANGILEEDDILTSWADDNEELEIEYKKVKKKLEELFKLCQ